MFIRKTFRGLRKIISRTTLRGPCMFIGGGPPGGFGGTEHPPREMSGGPLRENVYYTLEVQNGEF